MKSPGNKSISDETTTNGDLAKVRVIKKNLVYIIGLSPEIANEEILMKKEYYGQYGKVSKIVVNTNNAYNPKGSNGPSFSAYVTYSCEREASMAIIGSDEFTINERIIRASYGTTKYCQFFLKQQECPNLPECLYLHAFSKDKELLPKDEVTSSKSIFVGQTKMAISNLQKYIPELIKIKNIPINYTPALPSPQSIIQRLIDEDLLDIQTPPETQQIDVKVDKKKKDEDKPFIDQWSMDISVPQPQKKYQLGQSKTVEQQVPQSKQNSENKKTSKEEVIGSLNSPPREDQHFSGEKDSISKDSMNGLSLIHSNSTPCSNTNIINSNAQGISTNSASQADSQLIKTQAQSSSLIQNPKSPLEVTMFSSESPAQFVPKTTQQQIITNDKQSLSKENAQNSNFKKGKTSNVPSAATSTSNSNVSSTNHSRTSSISQKATSNSVTSQNHQPNNLKYIPQSQMNAYYEKKDNTKTNNNNNNNSQETKFVKHQYIPANQAQKSQVQNESLAKDQNPQKVESSQIQLNNNNKQTEKTNSNGTRLVTGISCTSPAPSQQHNQQIEDSKLQNSEETLNIIQQQIEPKYPLKKVDKICNQENPDIIIMKKLIKRTHNKNQTSCFEFARQNEAEGQEDIDIIGHIFDGTYIQLTKKIQIKQNSNNKTKIFDC